MAKTMISRIMVKAMGIKNNMGKAGLMASFFFTESESITLSKVSSKND